MAESEQAIVELAKESYDALLKALEYQDARTGRFLTAVAFFVTAAVAALINSDVRKIRFSLPPESDGVAIPMLSLTAFLVFVAATASYLVLSIGPPEPWTTPDRESGSHLSFTAAASSTDEVWNKVLVKTTNEMRQYRITTYRNSSLDIGKRAAYKYRRVIEARAAFFVAVPFFLVGGITMSAAFITSNPQNAVWGWPSAIAGSVVLAVTSYIAGEDRTRIESLVQPATFSDGPAFATLARCMALNAGLVFASSATTSFSSLQVLVPIAGAAVTIPAAIVLRRWHGRRTRTEGEHRVLARLKPWMVLLVGLLGFVVCAIPQTRPWTLLFAFIPTAMFEGVRLLDYTRFGLTPPAFEETSAVRRDM